ncbi:MAG TPA: EVE domain-containing protein [Steroidobacteraceae bacterium]|jgi:predicted RNA-binding protein with PUA-like domain|nr:EVE domain-containing protein [Steroidobacteraceae bacterium]
MKYWLLKTEPDTFGVDALEHAPRQTTSWEGVRNYQARNMLRDEMKAGDLAFFYHSSCPEPGIAAIVEIVRGGYPDASAWQRKSEYYDAKSPQNKPLWYTVDLRLKRRMRAFISLEQLREHADGALDGLWLLRRGNRLSITPLDAAHWKFILSLE